MKNSFPVYYAHVYDNRSSQWLTAYSFRPEGDGNKALEGHFTLCGHLVDYSMWSADSEVAESESGEFMFYHGGGSVGYSALEVVHGAAEGRGCYFRKLGDDEPRGYFEVYRVVNGVSFTVVFDAVNGDDAMAQYCDALGIHRTDVAYIPNGVVPVKKDRPTVAEVFALIEQIKKAVKDPKAGIRQKARNFRRALNNWRETGNYGNAQDVEKTFFRPAPGDLFERGLIPPAAVGEWERLVEAAKEVTA